MYSTKQKSYVMQILKNNKDKLLSPEDILDLLKESDEVCSKATLYRFLDNLVLTKEVRKCYNQKNNRFEYQLAQEDCSRHLHLKCKNCGLVIHLSCSDTEAYLSHISEEHGFLIDNFLSTIYGLCPKCRGNN